MLAALAIYWKGTWYNKPWKRYGIGAEYECYCDNVDRETWFLMVGKQYSDAGYAWAFPVSNNRIRIGVGIGRPDSNIDPILKLNEILEKKLRPLDRLKNIQPLEFHFGFIPNEGSRQTTIADRLIMVGDSAGQSNPLVLEGIRYAIEFGRLAGKVGVKSLAKGSVKSSLDEYERIWKSKVQSKINSAMKIQSRWMKLSDEDWDQEIEMLRNMSTDELSILSEQNSLLQRCLDSLWIILDLQHDSCSNQCYAEVKARFLYYFPKGNLYYWLKKRSLNLCRFCIC